MKKILNTAPMAVISTMHTPYSILLTTKVVGDGTLTQAQDITKNLWLPDRTLTPLVIEPVFSAYDQDADQEVVLIPTYTWYVNDVAVSPSATAADDFYIVGQGTELKEGSLVVRKNVNYDDPITIRCVATYQNYEAKAKLLLTSENRPDMFYQVDLMTPNTVEFHPLTDSTSQKTFKAYVQYGKTPLIWENTIGKSIYAVDLGTLTWNLSGTTFTASLPYAPKTTGGAALAGYTQDQSLGSNKTISTANSNIRIKDSGYATAAAFKSAMNGKVLFYELNEKTVNESFAEAMRKMTGFFWYLDGELITGSTYGYVSGQGTESLVLDADYIDGATISVRLGIPSFAGGSGPSSVVTMPTAPNCNAKAQSGLVWMWDNVSVLPLAIGGNHITQFSTDKHFDSVAKVNAKDLSAAKRTAYLKTRWFTHPSNVTQATKTYYGYGNTVTIPASGLRRTGTINVEVGTDIYLLGHKYPVTDPETHQVSITRNEVLIENPAGLVVITTKRTVLTTILSIKEGENGTLTQYQDLTKNAWTPNRSITPLVLIPVFSAINDKNQTENVVPEYTWYVNGTRITSTQTSADYYLETSGGSVTGNLVVRKNVSNDSPVTIKCVATYTDNLQIETYSIDKSVLLTTENSPDRIYMVTLDVPNTITYHPLTDETSQYTIHAAVQFGNQPLPSTEQMVYFWYLDDELMDENTLGVVSGLGTSTIVVDADYFDGVTISVKLGVPYYPSEGSVTPVLPTSPNINATAQCGLVWDYEDPIIIPVGNGGNAVRRNSGDKLFNAIVQVRGKNVAQEKVDKYLRMQWYKHSTNDAQNVRTMYDWGKSMTFKAEQLMSEGNANTEVGTDLYVLGEFRQVVGYDSYHYVNGELVGVGDPKMVVYDGKAVVSNG